MSAYVLYSILKADQSFIVYFLIPVLVIEESYDPSIINNLGILHLGLFEKLRFTYFVEISAAISLAVTYFRLIGMPHKVDKQRFIVIVLTFLGFIMILAIMSSVKGWQLGEIRKFQSMWFVLHFIFVFWVYSLVRVDRLSWKHLYNSVLYSMVLVAFGSLAIETTTHVKFFFLALVTVLFVRELMKVISKKKANIKSIAIIVLSLAYIQTHAFDSANLVLIFVVSIIFTLFYRVNFISNFSFRVLFRINLVVTAVFLVLPLFTLPADYEFMETGQYIDVPPTSSFIERAKFKLLDDRFSIWFGAIRELSSDMPSYLHSWGGRTFVAINHGSFTAADPDRRKPWLAGAHSLPLELLINIGLIGALPIIIIVYMLLYFAWSNRLSNHSGEIVHYTKILNFSVIGFMLPSILISNFMVQPYYGFFWFIFGLLLVGKHDNE